MKDHIHTPDDGRGPRNVFLNGKLMERVIYADTKKGVVRVLRYPFQLDRWRKQLLSTTLHGVVEVSPCADRK